jgi:hypothetical protein
MQESLTEEEQQERYKRSLHRRLSTCGSSDYPQYLAKQDIISVIMETNDSENLQLLGINENEYLSK